MTEHLAPTALHELVLSRFIAAPRGAVWRCWTEPALLTRWFAPKPYETPRAELDVRPGGRSLIVMRGPDGTEMPLPGVYLEVVPGERLVFTDAYTEPWVPSAKPFMTVIVTLADEDGGTRYHASVRHWSAADREQHEAMGFHAGWGQCADQLAEVAGGIAHGA